MNIVLCECTLQSPGGIRDCFSLLLPGIRHAQLALMQFASSTVVSLVLVHVTDLSNDITTGPTLGTHI